MSTQTFNLSLPKELVSQIDIAAKADYSSRSEYIRRAVLNQLRSEKAIEQLFDAGNTIGTKMGINSEQEVYDIIANK